jgi:uncharacterized lipoprotein YbaY
MKKMRYLALITACLAIGLTLSACSNVSEFTGPAPASTMVLLDGTKHTTEAMKGKLLW